MFVLRKAFSEKDREKGFIEALNTPEGMNIRNITATGWNETAAPYIEIAFSFDYALETKGGVVSFNPLLTPLFTVNQIEEDRIFPVDMDYPRYYQQLVTIGLKDDIRLQAPLSPERLLLEQANSPVTEYQFSTGDETIQLSLTTSIPKAFYQDYTGKYIGDFLNSLIELNKQEIGFTTR